MPGPMPFHLEKGPWITVLEDRLNASRGDAWRALRHLRGSEFGAEVDAYAASDELNGDPVYTSPALRSRHLREHWFGEGADGDRQPLFGRWLWDTVGDHLPKGSTPDREGAIANRTDAVLALLALAHDAKVLADHREWPRTGFWRQYHGDVETIVRETMAAALEVSLGVPQGSEDEADVTRHLPIEIFWKCPQRWFEGWLTWRLRPGTSELGQVTVIFATPGTGTPLLERAADGRETTIGPTATLDGARSGTMAAIDAGADSRYLDRGMWVITHEQNLLLPPLRTTRPTRRGDWLMPAVGPAYAGVGPVQVFEPSPWDGGVRGRPVQPSEEVTQWPAATSS